MIYLDNAATTQPLPVAADKGAFFANPSSPHTLGIASERALTKARQTLADILHCKPKELIFTSGGTESNNLAIIGYALALAKRTPPPVIFAEPWAHPSVLAPIQYAVEQKLTFFRFEEKLNRDIPEKGPVLVCLSHINHETGDTTDIASASRAVKKRNPDAVVFVDGAQGFCKDIHASQVYNASDIYSFSGHKCHTPAGVGGLMVRGGIKLVPLLHGGGQENNQRPGTENMAGIVQMAHTAQLLHNHGVEHHAHVSRLKECLMQVIDEIPHATVNAIDPASASPYILNMSFPGTRGEIFVHMLSERGICVSTGAACKSRKRDTSTLSVMGFPKGVADSALRFSFSHLNTFDEIGKTKAALIACVEQMRKVSGYTRKGI
jgi:cysteine desulfurase